MPAARRGSVPERAHLVRKLDPVQDQEGRSVEQQEEPAHEPRHGPVPHLAEGRTRFEADAGAAGDRDLAQAHAGIPGDAHPADQDRVLGGRAHLEDLVPAGTERDVQVLDRREVCHQAFPADNAVEAQQVAVAVRDLGRPAANRDGNPCLGFA